MASGNYFGISCGNSVSEVLKIASTELRELRAHYRTVTQRIRKLRIVVDALRELGGHSVAFEMESKKPSSEHALDRRSSVTTVPEEKFRQENKTPRKIRRPSPDLRRACRIALLEKFESVSIEEVYQRIVRRGSFAFANADRAMPAIVEELNALANDGELRRIEAASGMSWQRNVPTADPADSILHRQSSFP